MIQKLFPMLALCFTLASATPAKAGPTHRQLLFHNKAVTEQDFRIPAIVMNKQGDLVAIADRRHSKLGGDIGWGEIDIQNRISTDCGATWTGNADNPVTIVDGDGKEGFNCGHGDAAVVCDRETGEILMMTASGHLGFGQGGVLIGRFVSKDGGVSFQGGELKNMPEQLKEKKFFSSGRICQSRLVKRGTHHRIYAGICTAHGSQVVYSDDFGLSWNLLGNVIADGNECKIEELPNGSVLLSCRISGKVGRMFAVFNYTDVENGLGNWTESLIAEGITAASCNGEVLLVPCKEPGEYILLQSVARSDKRENVSIYWKRLRATDDYTNVSFYNDWDGYYPVSNTTSCYSTMVLDRNGDLAFLFEENNIWREYIESYDIWFMTIPVADIIANPKKQ